MPDVSRALLLPDGLMPADGVLKSLALYWDEIVVPDSAYRWSPVMRVEELDDPPDRSRAALELESAGIVRRHKTDIAAESLMPHDRPPGEDSDGELFLRIEKGDDGRARFTETRRIDPSRILDPGDKPAPEPDPEVLERNYREWREATASLDGDALMARARQCRRLAEANNLAPVAPSLLSHLASLTDGDGEAPVLEGALMSVALDAFVVQEDTPVDDIVAFRDRNLPAIQRFRAAMTDLAMSLRQPEIAPEAALSAARDVYRNRVEPDLGALGDRLSESRIGFLARSLFGAAALTVTPLTAPTVVESAARLGAQTINYRFSRQRLIEEHPYSFLHRLSKADFVIPRQLIGPDLVSPDLTPREVVYAHFDALFEMVRELRQAQDEPLKSPPRFKLTAAEPESSG